MSTVCILGVGKSGVAAARHAVAAGDDVTIYAGMSTAATRRAAAEFVDAGVPVHFDDENVRGHFDQCVVCPGIPQTGGFYKSALAASDELVSEPEYAWRMSPHGWVAITGTNGKTTTTALTAHLLNACHMPARACGNIGNTALEAVEQRVDGQILVAEMSSYQIASTRRFSPRVAALLNITPDHLAWHGSFESYASSKCKLFDNLERGATAVIADTVAQCARLERELSGRGVRVVTVGTRREGDCAYLDADGTLAVELSGHVHRLASADELQIKGAHNVLDALVAATIALDLGCKGDELSRALASFAPLAHRIEPCGSVGGVAFFNDSKATNADATCKALTAFAPGSVVLMLGGRDKGTDLDDLVAACEATCAAVVCYGEGGPRFYEAFAPTPVRRGSAPTMRAAFDLACRMARPGQSVLLSPACASFDEFSSFEQRGEVFKSYVGDYMAKEG